MSINKRILILLILGLCKNIDLSASENKFIFEDGKLITMALFVHALEYNVNLMVLCDKPDIMACIDQLSLYRQSIIFKFNHCYSKLDEKHRKILREASHVAKIIVNAHRMAEKELFN